jgi:hypothetical protein
VGCYASDLSELYYKCVTHVCKRLIRIIKSHKNNYIITTDLMFWQMNLKVQH